MYGIRAVESCRARQYLLLRRLDAFGQRECKA